MAKIKLDFIRRALIVFLAAVLVLPGFLGINLNSSKIVAGDGSSPDTPIIITTPAELDNIRNGLDKHYKLGNDIDLTDYLAEGGAGRVKWGTAGWEPIGNASTPFTGSLDGDGYVITGLWIDRTSTDNVGLFGRAKNASFKNLGVKISSNGITGRHYAGGLVGRQIADWGTASIINCYATGNVTATGYAGGGLVGDLSASDGTNTITNCYATGDVTAADTAGGLAGAQFADNNLAVISISNCYATGDVTATSNAGGLVGAQSSVNSTSSITNCYATGDVTAGSSAGGLVGAQGAYSSGTNTISNSYRYDRAVVTVGGTPVVMDTNPSGIHGGIVSASDLVDKDTYTNNNWLFNDSTPPHCRSLVLG